MKLWPLLFFILLFSMSAFSQTWVDFLIRGQDQSAANALQGLVDQLPKNTRSEYVEYLLKETINSLSSDCFSCTDDTKIVLFRGMANSTFNFSKYDSDKMIKVKGQKNPLILSRVLRTEKGTLTPNKVTRWRNTRLHELMRMHSQPSIANRTASPFISISYDSKIAAISKFIVVLKVDPERVILNDYTRFSEFEVLVPLFIHPREIMAIIEITPDHDSLDRNEVINGQFKILRNGTDNMNNKELKQWIQNVAREHRKFISKGNFDDRFDHLVRRNLKLAQMSKTSVMCSKLFEK